MKCRICNLNWIRAIRDGGSIFCMNHGTVESLREALVVFTMKCRQIIYSVICWMIPKELPLTLHGKLQYISYRKHGILWYEVFASYCTLWVKTNILTILRRDFLITWGVRVNFLPSFFTRDAKNLITNCIMQKRYQMCCAERSRNCRKTVPAPWIAIT